MAQNMMSDMTPEQMESMQKMAASMGGGMGMPPGAAEQMANLTPEEMKAQMDQLKNMDSSSMQSQFKEQQRMMSQQQDYKFGAAKMQKVEGNKLVKAGDFVQAVEKYELARRNLTGNRGTEAADVRQACTLNLALAHLKLKQWDKAIEVAGEGIAAQKDCLKGFYRRGLAYQGKGELQKAAADLRRAAEINPGDQSVEGCLVEVRAALDSAGQAEDTSVEAVVPEAPKVAANGMPGMDADMMKQATEAFKANPGMAKMAAEQMASMDDEQLAKLSEQMASTGMPAGMPKLTPDMAKQAAGMLKNMKPEDMEALSSMASGMQADGAGGSGGGMPDMAQVQEKMKDPKVRDAMMNMMKNIDADTMKEMSASMGHAMSDEQAKQMADTMANLSPETMEKIVALQGYAAGAMAKWQVVRKFMATPQGRALLMALGVAGIALLARMVYRWFFAPADAPPLQDDEAAVLDGLLEEGEFVAGVH